MNTEGRYDVSDDVQAALEAVTGRTWPRLSSLDIPHPMAPRIEWHVGDRLTWPGVDGGPDRIVEVTALPAPQPEGVTVATVREVDR